MRALHRLAPLAFTVLVSTACASVEADIKAEIEAGRNTLAALDRGIDALNNQPGLWRETLTSVVESIGTEAHDLSLTVSKEVKELVDHTTAKTTEMTQAIIGAAGAETRCNADFVGIRVNRQLQQIRFKAVEKLNAVLAKVSAPPVVAVAPALIPGVCTITPTSIQPGETTAVLFFGFDFNDFTAGANGGQFVTALEAGDGTVINPHFGAVAKSTNYLLQVQLPTDFGDLSPDQLPRLVLKWNNAPVSDIGGGEAGQAVVPVVTKGLADLRIRDIKLVSQPTVAVAPGAATVFVENVGAVASAPSEVEWRDQFGAAHRMPLQGIKRGGLAEVPLLHDVDRPDPYQIDVAVDPANTVDESDETNNGRRLTFTPNPARWKVTVSFSEVEVTDDEDDGWCTGDAGELSFNFRVNDSTQRWPASGNIDVTAPAVKTPDIEAFTLELNDAEPLEVYAGGVEDDGTCGGDDDSLGSGTLAFATSKEWGKPIRDVVETDDFKARFKISAEKLTPSQVKVILPGWFDAVLQMATPAPRLDPSMGRMMQRLQRQR